VEHVVYQLASERKCEAKRARRAQTLLLRGRTSSRARRRRSRRCSACSRRRHPDDRRQQSHLSCAREWTALMIRAQTRPFSRAAASCCPSGTSSRRGRRTACPARPTCGAGSPGRRQARPSRTPTSRSTSPCRGRSVITWGRSSRPTS
jgi:hypothetical protein